MSKTDEITPLPLGAENLHRFSRFYRQDAFMVASRKFWGMWEPIEIPTSASDKYLTVGDSHAGRLDLISYEAYGTPELWWVLAEANNIAFPPSDLVVGMVIRVPSAITVASLGLMR